MTKTKILGINLPTNFDPSRQFAIAAFCDVALEDLHITLRGCALAWSHGAFLALPPKAPGRMPGDLSAIQWDSRKPFAIDLCEKMVAAFIAFGGEMPEKTKAHTDHANAGRRVAEKVDNTGLRRLVGDPVAETLEQAGM